LTGEANVRKSTHPAARCHSAATTPAQHRHLAKTTPSPLAFYTPFQPIFLITANSPQLTFFPKTDTLLTQKFTLARLKNKFLHVTKKLVS
jgi:hypothetical protein